MKIKHTEDYGKLRQRGYPPITEFIDAMYWQRQGDSSKLDAYFAQVERVKKTYPKPKGKG